MVEGGGAAGLAAILPGGPLDRADLKGKKVPAALPLALLTLLTLLTLLALLILLTPPSSRERRCPCRNPTPSPTFE